MVPLWPGHFHSRRRQVIKVARRPGRQLNLIERKLVKPLLRHAKRHVWLDQAAGDEKRPITLFVEFVDAPVDDLVVGHLLITAGERRKLDSADAVVCRR